MGYEDLFRAGVALASSQFHSMKLDCLHRAWVADDGAGGDEHAAAVPLKALVEWGGRTGNAEYTNSGVLIRRLATLTILDPMTDTAATAGQVRQNPIDPRDIITLPDGSTAPIAEISGFTDVATTQPFALTVILGTPVRGN